MTNQEFIESIALSGEEWRDVVGYEGFYMVSSFGRIASLPRLVSNNTGKRMTKHRILSNRLSSGGYYQVSLAINGVKTQPHIHKLVAEAFIRNPYNYPQVDHIDCNRLNNNVSNLRWCTQSMNNNNTTTKSRRMAKMVDIGKKISESNSVPVLRVNISDSSDIKTYKSMIAAEYDGFCSVCISAVCSGKYKQHKGYYWFRLEDYAKHPSQH